MNIKMLKEENKRILYGIVCCIDIILLNIYICGENTKKDLFFMELIFITHSIFFISLKKNEDFYIDMCHIIMFLSIFVVFWLNSYKLQLLILLLLCVIQVLWVVKGYCIMNTKENPIERIYQKLFTVSCFLFTIILSFYLGRRSGES